MQSSQPPGRTCDPEFNCNLLEHSQILCMSVHKYLFHRSGPYTSPGTEWIFVLKNLIQLKGLMQITSSCCSPWHTGKPLVKGDDFHSLIAPSRHVAVYYILMKLNTNWYINLCSYCQNAKISHHTQITKTLKCTSFLNAVSRSCILNKEIF